MKTTRNLPSLFHVPETVQAPSHRANLACQPEFVILTISSILLPQLHPG